MPTTFVIGKKGGGKTLRAMRLLEDELIKTKRTVVTNLPIRYERFREYLVEKHGTDFGYKKRMLLLTTQQTARFWLYYAVESVEYIELEKLSEDDKVKHPEGKYVTHPRIIDGRIEQFEANDSKKSKITVPNFEERKGFPGVAYFVDEIHLTFNSRQWTRTGEDALWYISLERHFGDDQWFCTQCFGNVDKQMRDLGQEYLMCINQKKTPLSGTFGMVKRPGEFTCTHYSEPPTSNRVEAIQSYMFPLDKEGIASCYTTVADRQFGVGDGMADKESKPKGKIPFWALIVGAILLMVSSVMAMGGAANWMIGRAASGKGDEFQKVHAKDVRSNTPQQTPAIAENKSAKRQALLDADKRRHSPRGQEPEEVVYLTGMVPGKAGAFAFYLSNGQVRSSTDSDFDGVIKDAFGGVRGASFSRRQYVFQGPDTSRRESPRWR